MPFHALPALTVPGLRPQREALRLPAERNGIHHSSGTNTGPRLAVEGESSGMEKMPDPTMSSLSHLPCLRFSCHSLRGTIVTIIMLACKDEVYFHLNVFLSIASISFIEPITKLEHTKHHGRDTVYSIT